jgi:toxin ParE1/3/4
MKVTHADGVIEDLISLSFYLAESDEELANRFLDACDSTFHFLASNRFVGSLREFENEQLLDVRMWRVKGFEENLIFYLPSADGVKILHVIHSSRDYFRILENG